MLSEMDGFDNDSQVGRLAQLRKCLVVDCSCMAACQRATGSRQCEQQPPK